MEELRSKEAQLRSRAGHLVEEDTATRRARLRTNQSWARREMNRRVRKDRRAAEVQCFQTATVTQWIV